MQILFLFCLYFLRRSSFTRIEFCVCMCVFELAVVFLNHQLAVAFNLVNCTSGYLFTTNFSLTCDSFQPFSIHLLVFFTIIKGNWRFVFFSSFHI